MDVREEQEAKQPNPKLVTEDGMVTDVREEQEAKQPNPKLVTEDGMVIDVREEQPEKQSSPKLVTEDGMSMDVREEQPEKQPFPKLVTEDGMTVVLHPRIIVLVDVFIIALQFSRESYTLLFISTVIDSREEHSEKHSDPKLVTEDGMVMDVREEQ